MNYFQVTFSDGNSLLTGFNGTLEEARAYYLDAGAMFNFGDVDGPDHLVSAVTVTEVQGCYQVK